MRNRVSRYRLENKNKKCKKCKYRAQDTMPNNCDYILITGRMINPKKGNPNREYAKRLWKGEQE